MITKKMKRFKLANRKNVVIELCDTEEELQTALNKDSELADMINPDIHLIGIIHDIRCSSYLRSYIVLSCIGSDKNKKNTSLYAVDKMVILNPCCEEDVHNLFNIGDLNEDGLFEFNVFKEEIHHEETLR